MIKVLLCDLDGTLIDSESHYLKYTIEMMQELGFKKDINLIYQIIGETMTKTYDILEALLDYKVSRTKIIEKNEYFFNEYHPLDYQKVIFNDVKETLIKLKNDGIKLALCSSSSLLIIKKFIQQTKLEGVFDFIESGEDIKRPKPMGDTYLNALNYFHFDKKEAIVYEDSYLGIKAGINAGIFTCARKELRFNFNQSEADLIVDNIKQLYDYIWSINNEGKNNN